MNHKSYNVNKKWFSSDAAGIDDVKFKPSIQVNSTASVDYGVSFKSYKDINNDFETGPAYSGVNKLFNKRSSKVRKNNKKQLNKFKELNKLKENQGEPVFNARMKISF